MLKGHFDLESCVVLLKGHNRQHSCQTGQNFQTELMVKILSKSLVTAIKTHKGDDKWPLFVNKQMFWWSASIISDNNNDDLTDF